MNQDILHQAEKSPFPLEKENQTCSMMVLDNLVESQWILVDYDKPFLGDVLCSVKDDSSYLPEKSILKHFCPIYSILIDNKCYIFSWFDTHISLKNPCVAGKTLKQIDFKRLKVLFNAVNAEFPPIFAPDLKFILSYQRYSNIYKYERQVVKNNSTKGVYICSDNLILILKVTAFSNVKMKLLFHIIMFVMGLLIVQGMNPWMRWDANASVTQREITVGCANG